MARARIFEMNVLMYLFLYMHICVRIYIYIHTCIICIGDHYTV